MTVRLAKCAVSAAAVFFWAHSAFAQRAETMTWKIGGQARRALVYEPTADSAGGKAPLVFSFHGRGDNIEDFQHTDLYAAWPEAIVVYFQGLAGRGGDLSG